MIAREGHNKKKNGQIKYKLQQVSLNKKKNVKRT